MTIETPISTVLANPLANNATSVGQSVLTGETIINQPSDAKSAFDGTISASTSAAIPGSAMTADIASSAQFATAGTSFEASEASAVTIAEGGSAEIDGPGTQLVTFTGVTGTLTIDHALAFSGQISGLAGADALDLVGFELWRQYDRDLFGQHHRRHAHGHATAVHTANISLSGNYLSSGWTLSSDGHGGTVVVDPVPVNAWQELKIGAGGFLTGIDIAPDDTMVVRTDTYGAYIWNGQPVAAAGYFNKHACCDCGARLSDRASTKSRSRPSNTNILYMEYLGDVYRSTDKGTTWTKTAFAHVTERPERSPTASTARKWPSTPTIPMWSMSARRRMACSLPRMAAPAGKK